MLLGGDEMTASFPPSPATNVSADNASRWKVFFRKVLFYALLLQSKCSALKMLRAVLPSAKHISNVVLHRTQTQNGMNQNSNFDECSQKLGGLKQPETYKKVLVNHDRCMQHTYTSRLPITIGNGRPPQSSNADIHISTWAILLGVLCYCISVLP